MIFSTVIAENRPLRINTDQVISPEQSIYKLFDKASLNGMREVLWDVFSQRIVVTDDELGAYSRKELLRYHSVIVQMLEVSRIIADIYEKRIKAQNELINGQR